MEFLPKDFEQLHMSKIKRGFDVDNITSHYFFCNGNKMLFIKKSRNSYKLMCSCQCDFEPIALESNLEILFVSKDINEVVKMFLGYVFRSLNFTFKDVDYWSAKK